ncbi:MAG: PH domain-containing protein, partial [Ignavibacteriaceae bacterium]|nr:PH domain-containing protein [Ignavibacteriaceae bacterium]
MKIYASKIGLEIVIPFVLVIAGVLFLTQYKQPNLLGVLLILPAILLFVYILVKTKYTIEDKNLIIESGFIHNSKIAISTIKKISETNSILSSPATSLDRLEIIHGNESRVLISPKEKKEFIDALVHINPDICLLYTS